MRYGWGRKLCRVYIKDLKVDKKKMTSTYGCQNDEAVSMKICEAKAGTKIRVFDDNNFRTNDDWNEIYVGYNMGNNNCITVPHFQHSFRANGYFPGEFLFANFVQQTIFNGDQNLNGKVSSFTVSLDTTSKYRLFNCLFSHNRSIQNNKKLIKFL